MKTRADQWDDGGGLKWLYVDMNSYFASVEQQDNPHLRGRPVIVVPVKSEFTSAIAASHEAKALGVKTGTGVRLARQLCPDIAIIEARPDRYVYYHHKIIEEIEHILPVEKVCSIDEVACLLMGPEQAENKARQLGLRIQQAVCQNLGKSLTCSVGIGPSRLLAKTAADMKKPLGLTVLRLDTLPGQLLDIKVDDFAGIGKAMKARLHRANIKTVEQLWALEPMRLRKIWGGVVGDSFFYALHGVDPVETVTEVSSISHSHVLAANMRPAKQAFSVARRLTVKCGSRLRRMGYKCGGLYLSARTEQGVSLQAERRFGLTADSFHMLGTVESMWEQCIKAARLKQVSITCLHIVPADRMPDLFGRTREMDEDPQHMRLLGAMDLLNQRFGKDAVSIGPRADLPAFIGAKIAFNRVPESDDFTE